MKGSGAPSLRPSKLLQRLHNEGRDHIWAYYTRNMVRPVVLSRDKVDVDHRKPTVD